MSTRAVTLEGTVQITSLTPESVIRDSVLYWLVNNAGIGVRYLTIEQSWFSTLSTVTITVDALASQSQADVMSIVTAAFRNIAAANPDMMWNVGTFQITDWPSAGAQEGLGGGNSNNDGGLFDIGNFDGGTVYANDPTNTNNANPIIGGAATAQDDIYTWLKSHQIELILGGLALVLLLKRR